MIQDAAWANSLGVTEAQLNEWKALAEGHVSLLVWCLENQKIEEENYLAWAQKNYQVSQLNNEFFKSQPLPFDLFDSYYSLVPKNAIPVTLWDGVLFIACPDPLPTLEIDRPYQWVLASWIQIVNWRSQYEKELSAKSKSSSALSNLDFGNLGGEVSKTSSVDLVAPTPPPKVEVAIKEEPLSLAIPAVALESATPEEQPEPPPATTHIPPVVKSSATAAPAVPLKAPTVALKPTAPLAPKVNPPPKVSSPPMQEQAAEEKTVIQGGVAKPTLPKPAAAQPRPSSGTNTAIRK